MKWIGLLIFLMINYTVSAQSQRVVGNYVQSQLGEQFNGWFYFSANDSSGTELWKTQGDSAYFVKDFYLGYTYMFNAWTPNSGAPSAFTVYDGHLYFTIVDNATYLRRLVKMDANEVCTTITTTVNSNRIVGNLQVYNNKLYYFESGNNGTSLKSYDGTNHVTVHSIPNLTNLSYGASFFEFQSNLVFGYSDCNACNGYLYFYDGTTVTQGPQYFDNDYVVPPNNFSFDGGNLYYKKYELFQNDLYYIWKDSASNKIQHFDGTNTAVLPFNGDIRNELIAFNNTLFFNGDNGSTGFALWSFNGSNSQLVSNVHTGYGIPTPTGPTAFEIYNNQMFFSQADTLWNYELWVHDGATVSLYQELSAGYNYGVNRFAGMKNAGTYLYFVGNDDVLWNDGLFHVDTCQSGATISSSVLGCNPYSLPSGLEVNTPGVYHDTVQSLCGVNNIETIYIIDLSFYNVNTDITVDSGSIMASDSTATYQWLNCSNYSIVSGATAQVFYPTAIGDYAVIVSDSQTGCSDTSDCVTISSLVNPSNFLANIVLYPNPSRGLVTLKGLNNLSISELTIYNALGQIIPYSLSKNGTDYQINLFGQSGLYIIQIQTEQFTFEKQLILK